MKYSQTVLLPLAGLLSIVLIALGIYGFVLGTQDSRETTSPEELSSAFQEVLTTEGIERLEGHPIEGFDAALLLDAYPALEESDFDGVETFEGLYVYEDGELTFTRGGDQPVSSAERTVSNEGYQTLLDNVATRLGILVEDELSLEAVLEALRAEN